MEMQELGFGIGLYKRGMKVIVLKEFIIAVMLQQRRVKIIFKIEDGAFIGNGVGMGYRAFIAWFGDEHATIVAIQRMTENVKKKISFAYKTNAERLAVLRFGGTAIGTPAFEIHDAVKA